MATEEAKAKAVAAAKVKKEKTKISDLTVDSASAKMIEKARKEGVETIFDRAETMKACNIGVQGTCCKMCSQGPCRLPLPKSRHRG